MEPINWMIENTVYQKHYCVQKDKFERTEFCNPAFTHFHWLFSAYKRILYTCRSFSNSAVSRLPHTNGNYAGKFTKLLYVNLIMHKPILNGNLIHVITLYNFQIILSNFLLN